MLPLLVLLLISTPAPPAALPGADAFPPELSARLQKALVDKGPGYQPRTEHLEKNGTPKYTNRLVLESSPYLLQHAHNPVNWYPWGEEAFARARRENKPVLLSVGYSTCHWCHVMERESFEDEEIAAYLNRNYVAIKVDREQRPDLDGVYMTAVQMMSGSGGWPMTVWLTPERKPFYGGTYFPPRDGARAGRPGFLTLLTKLRQAYEQKPDQVAAAAQDIAAQLQAAAAAPQAAAKLDAAAAMNAAVDAHRRSFDRVNGGFGSAPKFPRPAGLEFLLRYAKRANDAQARDMALATLAAMQAGGLRDQIGGGFHRYSTDERWRVPHFEKMLYDNALLTLAYLDAYQASGRAELAEVARQTLAYVAREMTSPEGAFFSASDADSGGVEGAFFLWTPEEVSAVLGPERAKWFNDLYGVTVAGDLDGRSVLHLAKPPDQVARALAIDDGRFASMAAEARQALYEARAKRVAPHVDRKVVASWNGLMVSAYARAALVLGDEGDAARAARAAEFLRTRMTVDGRLARSAVDGRASGVGYLDDYAFVVQGLLDLFEATADVQWLRQALSLQKSLDAHFWDAAAGGYFLTPDDGEALLVRQKPDDDGAEPSGNAVAIANLLRLAEWTGDDAYRRRADQAMTAFAATVQQDPMGVPAMLSALDLATSTPKEIAIVEPGGGADAGGEALLAVLRRTFLPNRVAVVIREGAPLATAAEVVPWLRGKQALGGKTTAYVCERFVCDLPTSKPEVFEKQLQK